MYVSSHVCTRSPPHKQNVIAGQTFVQGLPSQKNIRIYDGRTGVLLSIAKTKPDGKFKVYVPHANSYCIVGVDIKRTFNAVIQDNVVPK